MLTGLLIAVPILLAAYAAQTDWPPHKIVLIAVVTVASAGIMALIDELVLDRPPRASDSAGLARPSETWRNADQARAMRPERAMR
jgi:hypothetical protein